MKNLVLIAVAMTSIVVRTYAQFDIAALKEIPEDIKKNASIIKRQEEIVFEVTDIDRAKYTVHNVYTVLNEEGNSALQFFQYTNKAVSLDDVEIKLFDANGKLLNRVKKKDIYKQADVSDVAGDLVYYINELKAPSYPVTVEYKYQVNYSGTLFYPDYNIVGKGECVQSSSFTAKVPLDLDLRYKEHEIKLKPVITNEGNYKLYKWTVNDLPAIQYDPGSVRSAYYYPQIFLAPNRFKIYNVEGDMSSWKKFGEWEYSLCNNLEILPEERVAFFKDLVKNAATEKEKVALVYNYLQKNFRYVSIQLGIGGYKPFPAKFTDEKKYGDCKALSFYTHSVLKALGIRSHVALINAGYDLPAVDPAFPMNSFNHMIVCVPQPKDTIWLECTSQTTDFNFLSNFTENKNALLITEQGGVLVHTPSSDPVRNNMSCVTNITLDEAGGGKSLTVLNCSGNFREGLFLTSTEKPDRQKEFIVNQLGFKQPDDFRFEKKDIQQYEIELLIEKIPEFIAGSKMFLRPRINRLVSAILPDAAGRTHDYYFDSPKLLKDTTVYTLPEGYTADVLPKKVSIQNDYVSYTTDFRYDENNKKVYSILHFCIKKNRIPAAQYAGIKKSFDEIMSDCSQKIIIKKG